MTRLDTLLVQVAPAGAGGVRDYIDALAAQWALQGQASHTIALSQALAAEQPLRERVLACLAEPGAGQPPACALVLHFSGYGYAPRGVCTWLLAELDALRSTFGRRLRVVVVFHELYAFGPPWRSAFWVMPMQAHIARRLAHLADALWTNTQAHARWLRGVVGPDKPLGVQPVFSTVGDTTPVRPAHERPPGAVVFGLPATRQLAFDALRRHESVMSLLGIEELIEIGPGDAAARAPAGVARRHLGRLAPAALHPVLESARFAVLDYRSDELAKSSVFAAYAAHGCVVLSTASGRTMADGLLANRDFFSLPAMPANADEPGAQTALASRLTRWYASHRLPEQAQQLLALAHA